MNWWSFVIGAVVGFILCWLLEILFWRRKYQERITELEKQLRGCRDLVAAQQVELASARAATSRPAAPAVETAPVKAAAPKAAAARPAKATPAKPVTPKAVATVAAAADEPAASNRIPAQNLAAIHGIGSVFEQKLYKAGIGTFAELSAVTDADLKAIIQPKEWQDFHYETWREDARKLAEKTGTVGAVWNGMVPDDLTSIKGIGETFEQQLYDAGVFTFADLASKSIAELEAILQPRGQQKTYLPGWIAEAQARASGK